MQNELNPRTLAAAREFTFRESLGPAVFSAILYGIGYAFFFLAIANLLFVRPLPFIGLVASVVWIAFSLGPLVSGCRKTGIRQHLGNLLGNFIRNRFAEFISTASGDSILGFGYQRGSTRHYFLKLRSRGITAVDWGPGQANIPGRDNDWSVALWFDAGSIVFDGKGTRWGIYIVGPSGHKAERAAFGNRFIEFLKANQVPLALPPAALLGQAAEVVEPLRPLGRIKVGTDEYTARPLERMLEKGIRVVIEEIRGTSIYVKQLNPPNHCSDPPPSPSAAHA